MFDITWPHITRRIVQANTAWYEIKPLEPGYGITIAHTLKRVLLSSLPGVAIVAVRIEGVKSASQVIGGVKEDMMGMILNLKQVRLRCAADPPISLWLEKRGAGKVTAADLIVPDTIEILNPECYIATLEQEYAHLSVELMLQRGRGYVPAIASPGENIIPIDAIYTPVRKVSYSLERTRVGKMVNFEKILLEIETDGAMTPDEALRQGGEILRQQFLAFAHPPHDAPKRHQEAQSDLLIPHKIYEMPLEILSLSVRSFNALKRNGRITKVGHILTRDERELLSIRNVGDGVLMEISDRLLATGCLPSVDQAYPQSGPLLPLPTAQPEEE